MVQTTKIKLLTKYSSTTYHKISIMKMCYVWGISKIGWSGVALFVAREKFGADVTLERLCVADVVN